MALSFPEITEEPHFEKTSFRIRKKNFATLDEKTHIAVLKLSLIDQSVFCGIDKTMIYPAEVGWGKHGWTKAELKKISKAILKDLLTASYCLVAPAQLSKKYKG
jgi:predicted DNA-binding protein (MmcQ/YjbR family)